MNKAGSNFIDREVELEERTTSGLLGDDELVAPFGVRMRESMEMLRECTSSSKLHQTVTGLAEWPKVPLATVERADRAPLAAARELIRRGVELWKQDRAEDALATFDEVVERFGDSEVTEVRGNVATALVNRGLVLGTLNRPIDALAACGPPPR